MENEIRIKAFQWINEQKKLYGDILPRNILEQGFYYNKQRVTLIGQSGIWKPKVLKEIPISITTSPNGPYNDAFSSNGYLLYKFRGTDPNHRDNKGLRKAMLKQVPLIYFHGILPGKYYVVCPVYIVGEDTSELSFRVTADSSYSIQEGIKKATEMDTFSEDTAIYRKYATREVKQRIHQSAFRERVLSAYDDQCAFCRLKHRELLDASHIIPDSEEYGEPIISNGLSLCKIHHAAFDKFFIGVTPDYKIEVRTDLLLEHDGPMLKYGIQELQGKGIILPKCSKMRPDRERLSLRYQEFRHHGL